MEEVINPTVVQLRLHPAFEVSFLKLVSLNALHILGEQPLPPQIIDDILAFVVREILDVQFHGRGFQYLIDCEGLWSRRAFLGFYYIIFDNSFLRNIYQLFPNKELRTEEGIVAHCDHWLFLFPAFELYTSFSSSLRSHIQGPFIHSLPHYTALWHDQCNFCGI